MPGPRRQGRRTLYGGVIIAALVALALAIFFLDAVIALFRRTYTVVAVTQMAPGIRSGTPVWVAGVQVGKVRQIDLLPPGDTLARVALDMDVGQSVAQQIRRDSEVRFTSARLMGETVIELLPGSSRSPQLADGDTLRVPPSIPAERLRAGAAQLRLELDSLTLDATALRTQMAARRKQVARITHEAGLARRELAALQAGMRGGALSSLMSLQRPGGPIDRAQRRAAEIQKLVGATQQRVGRVRRDLAPEQRRLMTHARELQANLAALRALLNQPVGTLGRMQNDSAVQRAFAGARAQLDSLTREARRNPLKFVF